jgi:hypothetical protein
LLPSEDNSRWHIQMDVTTLLTGDWDLVIAHPSCQYLANSGVRWLHTEPGRLARMHEAARFFLACLNANAPRVAVENPVMHGYGLALVGRRPDFTVQPWMFGDNAKKRTCFWTRGLPPLLPTSDLDGSTARADCHLASPSPDRWKERSRTYPGIAKAIAEQWGRA